MIEICKYRLPCGRCDKDNIFCDLSLEQIGNITSNKPKGEQCGHFWVLDKQEVFENKICYKIYECNKCGEKLVTRAEIRDDGKVYEKMIK